MHIFERIANGKAVYSGDVLKVAFSSKDLLYAKALKDSNTNGKHSSSPQMFYLPVLAVSSILFFKLPILNV